MPEPYGQNLPWSVSRRFMSDLVHFGSKVPAVAVRRRMMLGRVVAARNVAACRPCWPAIFLKAYGMVTAANPAFRRAYLSLPRHRLYEHPRNVASIAVERVYQGEQGVFFLFVPRIEQRSLLELDEYLRLRKEAPVESIAAYRRILRLGRLPRPLRRFLWWLGLNLSGRLRARFFGTFGFTVLSGMGASIQHILSPLTTNMSYGVFDEDGSVEVHLAFDHRILDGAVVSRALLDMEKYLNSEILTELLGLHRQLAA